MNTNCGLERPLRWSDVYQEADLYKAAVRLYTKPLFQWRKALSTSTDGRTLYDLAGGGLRSLDAIHRLLNDQRFEFRPAVALNYNFNGKHRTLYISPWEERIVDLVLYRALNQRLHDWFSPNSYAYRDRTYSLDRCQARIARTLRQADGPIYAIKRDISDYFPSVDHAILLRQLAALIDESDYLFKLVEQRVRFPFTGPSGAAIATTGIPFGSAVACVFANIYLTGLDRSLEGISGLAYFRYADDFLILSQHRPTALLARDVLGSGLSELKLKTKPSHRADLLLSAGDNVESDFSSSQAFRHLGLLFRTGGAVELSRDKQRKIQNLFRFAFRRGKRRWARITNSEDRARALATLAAETAERGVRNVAILDYYLKHVDNEAQLRRLDRWLAEEILSLVFGGHRKGHFRRIGFDRLRQYGLPSLVHRRRLIRSGRIESPFFIWQRQKASRAFSGTVARLERGQSPAPAFSPHPEAAAG